MSGRVLIAEDNAALQAVIEFTVSKAGFETEVVNNGWSALQLALASSFDIVISDQQMPRMTGVDLCRQLRENDLYRETPFVLLTAKRLELNIDQLKTELGISEVLPKPFSPQRLADLLRELAVGVG